MKKQKTKMKQIIAFWNILRKDMKTYYLKPPNLSWGIIFPLAWTLMFFIRSSSMGGSAFSINTIREILPGILSLSILFGTTSMLAVTITFEKKAKSFERLLLAPIPLETLMIAKTSGAIVMGILNAIVPMLVASLLIDLSGILWWQVIPSLLFIAISSTFVGLFIAVSVSEVFEAQTFSNFFRFPMIFLCGLFFPIEKLPVILQPVSYVLPLTYGADILHGAINKTARLPIAFDFLILILFCIVLFIFSMRNIQKKWIT